MKHYFSLFVFALHCTVWLTALDHLNNHLSFMSWYVYVLYVGPGIQPWYWCRRNGVCIECWHKMLAHCHLIRYCLIFAVENRQVCLEKCDYIQQSILNGHQYQKPSNDTRPYAYVGYCLQSHCVTFMSALISALSLSKCHLVSFIL